MGVAIFIHVEYKHRKKKYYHSNEEFNLCRHIDLFRVMGLPSRSINPLYPCRGLPGNVTLETYKEYAADKPDFHDASWLSTDEFQSCIDYVRDVLYENDDDPGELLQEYQNICNLMKESDLEGEHARIVFWFMC